MPAGRPPLPLGRSCVHASGPSARIRCLMSNEPPPAPAETNVTRTVPDPARMARLRVLVRRWEEQNEQGATLPLEELCRDDPDLLEPLRDEIEALRGLPRPPAP